MHGPVTSAFGSQGTFMSSREAFAVGARLLSIVLLVFGLSGIASLPATWEAMAAYESVRRPWMIVASGATQAIIYLAASALLWFRHPVSTVPESPKAAPGTIHAVALSLLGVYLVATGLPALIEAIFEGVLVESTFLFASARIVPQVIAVSIGGFLIARAKQLLSALCPA